MQTYYRVVGVLCCVLAVGMALMLSAEHFVSQGSFGAVGYSPTGQSVGMF